MRGRRRVPQSWAAHAGPSFVDAFYELKADYDAARPSRFRRRRTGVPSSGAGADWHIRSDGDLMQLIEVSRHFDRNDSLVGQGVSRLVSYVMGDGFPLYPDTGDVDLDAALQARWEDWATDPAQCHSEGEHDFHTLAELIFRSTIIDGDAFALPREGGFLQIVEAHRCRTPSRTHKSRSGVVHGVDLDEERRRTGYWFTNEDLDPFAQVLVSKSQRFDAWSPDGDRAVFHVFDPKRTSQTRGIGALASIMDVAGMLEDVNVAKLIQQQVVSCFAIIREQSDRGISGTKSHAPLGEQTVTTTSDGRRELVEGIQPGAQIVGQEGETIKGFSPNVPNAEYFQQAHLLQMIIAANLELPIAILLLDAESTNYSGFRGAFLAATRRFRKFQSNIIRRFHSPAYAFKVRDFLALDPAIRRVSKRSDVQVFRHRFHPRGWPYIDPHKEAAAHLIASRNGIRSLRSLHAELGQWYPAVVREIVDDHALAIEVAFQKAEALNEKFPDLRIHWRELLSLPMPEGVTVSIAPSSGSGSGSSDDSEKKDSVGFAGAAAVLNNAGDAR